MQRSRFSKPLAALALAALMGGPFCAGAADEDVFAFIPDGGRTLLAPVLGGKASADDVRALIEGKRTREEWLKYLREHSKSLTGLGKLDDKQMQTLADYLSFNMPLPPGKIPSNPTTASWEKSLPPDGRDYVLKYCQGCHIVTVVVTQDRSREAWFGTLGKPSHVQIKLDRSQREAVVNYLLLNGAIPIDQVPEDLRAGGATY